MKGQVGVEKTWRIPCRHATGMPLCMDKQVGPALVQSPHDRSETTAFTSYTADWEAIIHWQGH